MTFAVFLSHLAEQLNSAVFVLLLILGAVLWAVYKVGQIVANWNNRDNELTKLRADWNRDIPPLQAKMNLVFQKLCADTSVKAESPTRLTEVGR